MPLSRRRADAGKRPGRRQLAAFSGAARDGCWRKRTVARPVVGDRQRGMESRDSGSRLVVSHRVGRSHFFDDGREPGDIARPQKGIVLQGGTARASRVDPFVEDALPGLAFGQDPVGANGSQREARDDVAHQEYLRLGDARYRRKAGLCLLRQFGRLLL